MTIVKLTELELKNIKRILIVMPGGIGNLILLIPCLRALRQNFPDKMITLLTSEPGVENILKGEDLVDEFVSHCEKDLRNVIKNIYFLFYMRSRKFDLAIISTGTNPSSGDVYITTGGAMTFGACTSGTNNLIVNYIPSYIVHILSDSHTIMQKSSTGAHITRYNLVLEET